MATRQGARLRAGRPCERSVEMCLVTVANAQHRRLDLFAVSNEDFSLTDSLSHDVFANREARFPPEQFREAAAGASTDARKAVQGQGFGQMSIDKVQDSRRAIVSFYLSYPVKQILLQATDGPGVGACSRFRTSMALVSSCNSGKARLWGSLVTWLARSRTTVTATEYSPSFCRRAPQKSCTSSRHLSGSVARNRSTVVFFARLMTSIWPNASIEKQDSMEHAVTMSASVLDEPSYEHRCVSLLSRRVP